MSDSTKKPIQIREHKKPDNSVLLEIKLNNPAKLNVLNLEMIFALNHTIKKWQNREELSLIFIHAEGERAFSAGGDVAQIYFQILEGKKKGGSPSSAAKDFFQTEYETDYLLSQFPKPVVLWGNGIVMGGGMGLFMASSHPIMTETSMMAMPEANIGFFPDVGASYFLSKIKNNLGKYLALTGCRLNASEACFLEMAEWVFEHKDKQKVFDFLMQSSFKHKTEFNDKFNAFYEKPLFLQEQNCWIKNFQEEITKSLKFKTLPAFYDYLSQAQLEDKKWEKNRHNFLKASPTSLAVIFEQLKRAKLERDLKTLFEMELVIALQMACNFDFMEGVRALLIDKTKNPKWRPGHVDNLDPLEISKYFMSSEVKVAL